MASNLAAVNKANPNFNSAGKNVNTKHNTATISKNTNNPYNILENNPKNYLNCAENQFQMTPPWLSGRALPW